jgi:hypothetical protein
MPKKRPLNGEFADTELFLSEDSFARIAAAIEGEHRLKQETVEFALAAYRVDQDAKTRSRGRGLRADLKELTAKVSAAHDALKAGRLQLLVLIGLDAWPTKEKEQSLIRRLRVLMGELKELAIGLDRLEKQLPSPLATNDLGTFSCMMLLSAAFTEATGKRPTHNTHVGGAYQGRPLSPFGRFVVAFFQEVDPTVTETMCSTFVRKHIDVANNLSAARNEPARKS